MIEGVDTSALGDAQDAVAALFKDFPGLVDLADAPEFEADALTVPVDAGADDPGSATPEDLALPDEPGVEDPFLDRLASGDRVDLPRELSLPNPFRPEP
jgi:hypothetical protein